MPDAAPPSGAADRLPSAEPSPSSLTDDTAPSTPAGAGTAPTEAEPDITGPQESSTPTSASTELESADSSASEAHTTPRDAPGRGHADTEQRAHSGPASTERPAHRRTSARSGADLPPPALTVSPAMRMHLQGAFLLVVLVLIFGWVLNWGVDVIGSAIGGPDGAVVARALDAAEQAAAEPLEGGEVAELQEALLFAGYDPGPVDGILGELTRAAIEQLKSDLGRSDFTDRELFNHLLELAESRTE